MSSFKVCSLSWIESVSFLANSCGCLVGDWSTIFLPKIHDTMSVRLLAEKIVYETSHFTHLCRSLQNITGLEV